MKERVFVGTIIIFALIALSFLLSERGGNVRTTEILIPTSTIVPTETLIPTNTLIPTKTLIPTIAPTPDATKTQQAKAIATVKAQQREATKIAWQATETVEYQQRMVTATVKAQQRKATAIAQYQKIDYRELVSYPEEHIGEKVLVEGRVFNVNSTTQMQIFLGWTSDAAYIIARESFYGIYEDDRVIVYGVVDGENCGENAYGAEICQPLIIKAIVKITP